MINKDLLTIAKCYENPIKPEKEKAETRIVDIEKKLRHNEMFNSWGRCDSHFSSILTGARVHY